MASPAPTTTTMTVAAAAAAATSPAAPPLASVDAATLAATESVWYGGGSDTAQPLSALPSAGFRASYPATFTATTPVAAAAATASAAAPPHEPSSSADVGYDPSANGAGLGLTPSSASPAVVTAAPAKPAAASEVVWDENSSRWVTLAEREAIERDGKRHSFRPVAAAAATAPVPRLTVVIEEGEAVETSGSAGATIAAPPKSLTPQPPASPPADEPTVVAPTATPGGTMQKLAALAKRCEKFHTDLDNEVATPLNTQFYKNFVLGTEQDFQIWLNDVRDDIQQYAKAVETFTVKANELGGLPLAGFVGLLTIVFGFIVYAGIAAGESVLACAKFAGRLVGYGLTFAMYAAFSILFGICIKTPELIWKGLCAAKKRVNRFNRRRELEAQKRMVARDFKANFEALKKADAASDQAIADATKDVVAKAIASQDSPASEKEKAALALKQSCETLAAAIAEKANMKGKFYADVMARTFNQVARQIESDVRGEEAQGIVLDSLKAALLEEIAEDVAMDIVNGNERVLNERLCALFEEEQNGVTFQGQAAIAAKVREKLPVVANALWEEIFECRKEIAELSDVKQELIEARDRIAGSIKNYPKSSDYPKLAKARIKELDAKIAALDVKIDAIYAEVDECGAQLGRVLDFAKAEGVDLDAERHRLVVKEERAKLHDMRLSKEALQSKLNAAIDAENQEKAHELRAKMQTLNAAIKEKMVDAKAALIAAEQIEATHTHELVREIKRDAFLRAIRKQDAQCSQAEESVRKLNDQYIKANNNVIIRAQMLRHPERYKPFDREQIQREMNGWQAECDRIHALRMKALADLNSAMEALGGIQTAIAQDFAWDEQLDGDRGNLEKIVARVIKNHDDTSREMNVSYAFEKGKKPLVAAVENVFFAKKNPTDADIEVVHARFEELKASIQGMFTKEEDKVEAGELVDQMFVDLLMGYLSKNPRVQRLDVIKKLCGDALKNRLNSKVIELGPELLKGFEAEYQAVVGNHDKMTKDLEALQKQEQENPTAERAGQIEELRLKLVALEERIEALDEYISEFKKRLDVVAQRDAILARQLEGLVVDREMEAEKARLGGEIGLPPEADKEDTEAHNATARLLNIAQDLGF